jgi:hypothetical protein
MTNERAKALENLAILCRDISPGTYDDPNGPYRYSCCHAASHGPQAKGHDKDCWYEKLQTALAELDKLS